MAGAREVAMITGCLEKFSARREREAGNVGDSKGIFYRRERLAQREGIARKILVGMIRTGSTKPFVNEFM